MPQKTLTITNQDLRGHHIGNHAYSTDTEYTKIARNLYKQLLRVNIDDFDRDIVRDIAIKLTLYLEDTIADAGVWRSFCTEYHRLYGEWLPFGLAKEEPVLNDVSYESCLLIVWMTIVKNEDPRYISPTTLAVRRFAEYAFAYFNSIFEDTSINEEMLCDLYSEDTTDDFIKVRSVLTWLANPYGCYLSDWDVTYENFAAVAKEIQMRFNYADVGMLRYATEAAFPFEMKVGPLAIMAKDWYADMLETYSECDLKADAKNVRSMEYKPYTYYLIEQERDESLIMQDKYGQHFEVVRSSFAQDFELQDKERNVAETSFVSYKGVWNNNGVLMLRSLKVPFSEYMKEFKEKEDSHARAKEKFEDYVASQNGRRMYYFDGVKSIKQWLQDEVIHQDAAPLLSHIPLDMQESNGIMAFIPKESDLEFLWGHIPSIADPLNQFYDPEDDCAIDIFDNSTAVHGECLRYMLSHGMMRDCRFYYGDTTDNCHQLFQSNIDFLARFYRRGAY